MHVSDAPVLGDTVTGVVTAYVGASTGTDDDGNEVTYARYEVEVCEPLCADDEPKKDRFVEKDHDVEKVVEVRKENEKGEVKKPVPVKAQARP